MRPNEIPGLFALAFCLPAVVSAEKGPGRFSLTQVGPGVFAAISSTDDPASPGNAGFVIGSDGVLVVGAFGTPQVASDLLTEVRRETPRPVRWLVRVYDRLDRIGGEAVLAKAGAVIAAREREISGTVPPDLAYRDAITIWLGDRRVEVLARPGPAGGSIVWVPDAGVVFGGALVWKNTVPELSDARVDAWIETLDGLLRDYPAAAFVPGRGGLAKPLDVRFFRDYLRGLRLSVAQALAEGKSGAALAQAVKPRLAVRYSGWTRFSELADENIAAIEGELTGTKARARSPAP